MSNPHDEAISERPMHGHDEAFSEQPHGHGHAAVAPAAFNDTEIAQFHGQDLYAAKVVVCLMVGIFSVGVVLYTIVASACATGP
jgi:hypothetical protein